MGGYPYLMVEKFQFPDLYPIHYSLALVLDYHRSPDLSLARQNLGSDSGLGSVLDYHRRQNLESGLVLVLDCRPLLDLNLFRHNLGSALG